MGSNRLTGYDRALMELRSWTSEMVVLVREQIAKARFALKSPNNDYDWRASDKVIDQKRDQILNRSMDIMSLQQLRPKDIRWILGFQRIAQELERIADYACDLVELHSLKQDGQWPPSIHVMGKDLLDMIDYCVGVLTQNKEIDLDLDEKDDILDQAYAQLQQELIHGERNMDTDSGMILIMARTIERMGDHIVNVAEMLLYTKTGKRRLTTDS